MKTIVKSISAVMALLMALCLCSCGEKKSETTKKSSSTTTLVYGKTDLSKFLKLGDYKGIEIDTSSEEYKNAYDEIVKTDIEDNDIFDKKTEGKVQNGDIANIDYEGKRDGVAFEGGTDEGHDLEIGSGSFIEGFEEGLIGVRIGDTVDLNLKFPDDYGNKELAGADVVFTVKVNYVKSSDNVNVYEHYSELGFQSEEVYKENLKERAVKSLIFSKVRDNCEVLGYPEEDRNTIVDAIYEFYDNYYNLNYSVSFDYVLSQNGMEVEDYKKMLSENLEDEMTDQMITYSILKKEALSPEYELSKKEITEQPVLDEISKVNSVVEDYLYSNAKIK